MEILIAVLAVAVVAVAVNVAKSWRRARARRGVAFTKVHYLGPAVHLGLGRSDALIGHASDVKVQHRQVVLFVPLMGSAETRAAMLHASRTGDRVSVSMVMDDELWTGSGLVTAVFDEHALHPWCVRLELGGMAKFRTAINGTAGAESQAPIGAACGWTRAAA